MGKCFNQITKEDRIVINHLLKAGINKNKIANQLGFHRSTIYREIERRSNRLGYMPFIMERKLARNRKRGLKLDSNKQLRSYVFKKLQLSWSPEQIAGRLKMENKGKSVICHETIYSYPYSDYGIRNRYYLYLKDKRLFRYPKISRRTRILIPNRVPILERPDEIRHRKSLGHWEGDLMVFGKKAKTNLITLRERQSRYMLAIKNKNRKAASTAKRIIKAFDKLGKHRISSLTLDNGPEFARHEKIAEKLSIKTYFCEPYKSYQKGTIENGNKQLREWFSKNASIDEISPRTVRSKLKLLNQRPMKCLGFNTPNEIFFRRKTLDSKNVSLST
jgi:IS30 family transposase